MSRGLKIDNQLDNNLRQLKIGDTTTPIELATDKVRIKEHTRLSKDLTIEGDLYLEGSTADLKMTNGVELETTTATGVLGLRALGLSIYGALYSGDGDTSDNNAVLGLLPSDGQDAQIKLYESAAIRWSIGNDASDSDKLKFDVNDAVGGATKLTLESDGDLITVGDVTLAATKGLYLDGGGDTYLYEASADIARVVVGGDQLLELTEDGADGNSVNFKNSCAGFTQLEPTYDATNTVVDFRHSNKQNLTFGAGSITNIQLFFPQISGNFQLLLKQDGTGSRTITNYRVYEYDETTADGSASAKFAGGSNPTLTTYANHVDILSFYWDADNEICYGVATLDFQF